MIRRSEGAVPVRAASFSLGLRWAYEHRRFASWDVWRIDVEAAGSTEPLICTSDIEFAGSISPDGRSLAYVSDESGRYEVYVTTLPETGPRVRVSTSRGTSPLWSPIGQPLELFYREGNAIMSVRFEADEPLSPAASRKLFEGAYAWRGHANAPADFDVFPDGERFLLLKPLGPPPGGRITLVQNWFEELKTQVPVAAR